MKANIESNSIDILQVQYQDYLNIKGNILKHDSKRM